MFVNREQLANLYSYISLSWAARLIKGLIAAHGTGAQDFGGGHFRPNCFFFGMLPVQIAKLGKTQACYASTLKLAVYGQLA
eukprot:1096054-Pelagomonas_calceolata.AAC.1